MSVGTLQLQLPHSGWARVRWNGAVQRCLLLPALGKVDAGHPPCCESRLEGQLCGWFCPARSRPARTDAHLAIRDRWQKRERRLQV